MDFFILNIQPQVNEIIEKFLKEVVVELKQNIKGKNASGELEKSIKYTKDNEKFIISFLNYGLFVDQGRKPGSFPPIKNIRDWCRIKGIDEKASYAISYSIKKNGIKAYSWIKYKNKPLDDILDQINNLLYINLQIFKK